MSSDIEKGTSTAIWDFGIVGLMLLVLVLALSEATRPIAIGLGGLVPAGLGIILLIVGLIDLFAKGGGDRSSFFYLALFVFAGVVCGLGQTVGGRQPAILIGVGLPWVAGLAVCAIVGIMSIAQMLGAQHRDSDFSSFIGPEEQSFLGQERTMRANSKSANVIGFGVAGALFVVGIGVTVGLYTPCARYCKKPPTACKKDAEVAAWKASCENTCDRLEHESGLQVLRSVTESGEKKEHMEAVSGREYVEALDACNFANGAGATCEKIVEKAVSMGLWCPDSDK